MLVTQCGETGAIGAEELQEQSFPADVKVEMFSENLRDVSCCLLSAILLEPSVEHAHLRFDYEFVLF